MSGGLLNIVSVGNNNVFLTGNPSKTFFKTSYAKYSNFGLQKFRIDYDGLRDLRPNDSSTFTFKIPRYAELLMDTYLVVTIPDIWSPIYQPSDDTNGQWSPYEFRWIENLGITMIEEIVITCGSLTLQQYSGQYLSSMVERDFTKDKKDLFNAMTGNTVEFYDPANAHGRANVYPNALYTINTAGAEPSIRGRNIYIPINTWFTLNANCAFPLIALQYNELVITVTMRPISDLFILRDVFDNQYQNPYVAPDFNQARFQMYRFLQTPPDVDISPSKYNNKLQTWNADIHILATYCFLSKEEAKIFAQNDQVYLIKDVFQYNFQNVAGSSRIKLYSSGMISNWMWYLQRDDVDQRNEWNNYTNWPYRIIPSNIILCPNYQSKAIPGYFLQTPIDICGNILDIPGFNWVNSKANPDKKTYSPSVHPNRKLTTGINVTGDYHPENQKTILNTLGIVLNGDYRENIFMEGIYDYVEKYTRTPGFAKEGLYCYNFGLNTSQQDNQPSGAINLSNFKTIELDVTTYLPPIDLVNSRFDVVCDTSGNPIGVRKSNYKLYPYNYNLTVFEERYNVLSFIGGNCGLLYSR